MMQPMVKIVHPDIEGEHEVPERSVRIWVNSGWKRADEVQEQPLGKGGELLPGVSTVTNDGPAEPLAGPKQERRRRAQKESD